MPRSIFCRPSVLDAIDVAVHTPHSSLYVVLLHAEDSHTEVI